MSFFSRLISCFMIMIAVHDPLFADNTSNRSSRTIWHPMFQSQRLDYCFLEGKGCGKPVADRYCELLGYERSNQSVIAYNVGLTHYLSSRAQCKGWRCNGFMAIGCVSGSKHRTAQPYHYTEKQFVYPRFNQFRVDWCYNQNQNCGAMAANSFCSRMGYLRAKHYEQESKVSATKAIGSQELCFGDTCKGFRQIICSRDSVH